VGRTSPQLRIGSATVDSSEVGAHTMAMARGRDAARKGKVAGEGARMGGWGSLQEGDDEQNHFSCLASGGETIASGIAS
jgi:hypothetical protein